MTHDEMIKLIEAHEKGERLEYKPKNKKDWHSLPKQDKNFDFAGFDYRIKPKEEPKFKVGDTIIKKEFADLIMFNPSDLLEVKHISTDEVHLDQFYDKYSTELYIHEVNENYINVDDCLWYWEGFNPYAGKWETSTTRYTKRGFMDYLKTYSLLYEDLQPLYALGFRLPKDEK